jgi:hypothetical protein
MSFCLETPKWESWNSQNWDFCNFGGTYIYVQTSDLGEVQSKVVAFVKNFSMVCGIPPARKEIRAIPDP